MRGVLRSFALGLCAMVALEGIVACSDPPDDGRDATTGADGGPSVQWDDDFEPSSTYWDGSAGNVDGGAVVAREGPVRVFAFGSTSCAIVPDRKLKCWGQNTYGLVGNGDAGEQDVIVPTTVAGIAPTTLAGGEHHVCASDGKAVWCWGLAAYGALGTSSAGDEALCADGRRCRLAPNAVPGLDGIRALASGEDFSCAVLTDGTVRCWGKNDLGQLGTLPEEATFERCEGVACSSSPIVVPGLTDVEHVAAGRSAACARTRAGDIYCWGRLFDAYVGTVRHTAPTLSPTILADVRAAEDVAIGADHACVIYGTSAIGCMGTNGSLQCLASYDQRVVDTLTPRPLAQSPLGFRRLALGGTHSCALGTDETVSCWGNTSDGQIRASCVNPAGVAVKHPFSGVTDVSAGLGHTCVALVNGDVFCFGRNDHGQLGGEVVAPLLCSDPQREAHVFRQVAGLL